MAKTHLASGLLLTLALAPVTAALADNPDIANKSNNPLSLAPGLNLQDYYTPRVYDSNIHTNDALLRGALPVAPNDFIGVPQLLRATLPISTRPEPVRYFPAQDRGRAVGHRPANYGAHCRA